MADGTFENILVKDDRIGCLTNKVKYQVLKGGQNITSQPFNAISATTSAHVYNITVPSLETIISREVLWQTEVTLKITGTGKPASEFLVNYGVTDALAAFPLHSLVTNMTATINNNTVSMNVQDTLPLLLRLLDAEEMAKYECMTPTTLDYLGNLRDGVYPLPYGLTQYTWTSAAAEVETVGSDAPATSTAGTRTQCFYSYPNNTLAYDMNRPGGTAGHHKPRGSWKLLRLFATDGSNTRAPLVTDTTVYATFRVCEPLLLSPFVFGSPDGKQGFYGIQTMNLQMNISANASRAWRSISTTSGYTKSAVVSGLGTSIQPFANSRLIFTFMTPHASDMLEPRNVIPYYELPIYRTTGMQAAPSAMKLTAGASGATGGAIPDTTGTFIAASAPPTISVSSNNIQLNCVPDKLIICLRKQIANLTCCDTDNYLTIQGISITWNNQAGLMSTFTPDQLYRASIASGLHNMSWDEFSGSMVSNMGDNSTINSKSNCDLIGPYMGVGAHAQNNGIGVKLIPTTGSILVLDFATVIQLTEEYYAPGSLGSFNLQVQVTVSNLQYDDWTSGNYEMIVMPMNTGVFVNEKGTSSTFIALLTKEDVIQASSQEPYTNYEVKRMVGGSFLSGLKSSLGWLSSKMPFVKQALSHIDHPMAKTGHNVLHALGYGKGRLENRLM